MARNKRDETFEQIRILVQENQVSGLSDLLFEEEAKGAVCAEALDGLLEINTSQAWEAIGQVLAVDETAVAEQILDRLAASKVPGAVRALGQCLGNPHVFLRSQAVRALSRNWSPATMPHLLRASRDPEPSIARNATRILRRRLQEYPAILMEIRASTAEGIIDLVDLSWAMTLASDSFPEHIRSLAVKRIGGLGGEEATQCLIGLAEAATGDLREVCWQTLESCSEVSDFLLLPLLAQGDAATRARALRLYGRVVDKHGAALMEGLSQDPAPEVREAALAGLARIEGTGAIRRLYAALKDKQEPVRLQAMRLLGEIPDSSPELVDAAMFFKGALRKQAIIHLANRGLVVDSLLPFYFEFLLQGGSCTDPTQTAYLDAIHAVAKALAKRGLPEGLIAFTGLARSIIRRIRRAAIEAIMAYDPNERADALASLMDSEDRDVLRNVAEGLHEIRDRRAVIPLIRVVMTLRGRPARRAKIALAAYKQVNQVTFLLTCLKTRWAAVRKFAADKLAALNDPSSVPALLEASHDEDVEVQLAVIEALGPFAGQHGEVTARMLEVVGYGDVSVRQMACEALGIARCKEAVPDLVKALHNYFLRPRAEQALKMIGDRKGYLAIKRLERRERLFPKKPRDIVLRKKKARAP